VRHGILAVFVLFSGLTVHAFPQKLEKVLFPGPGTESPSPGQKADKEREKRELIARCKTRIVKKDLLPQPKDWQWGKDEKYRGAPVTSYNIQEDGSIANAKLKRGSGVRGIDEYALNIVKGRKYEAVPGCPGVESTETVIIDFQAKN
jgi:hypothetical protein